MSDVTPKQPMENSSTGNRSNGKNSMQKTAYLALYTVLALIIYLVECQLPPLTAVPGIKLGLSNIVTLILLRDASFLDCFKVLLARILLASLLAGQFMSFLYSFAGGMLCLIVTYLINKLLYGHYILLTSMLGAVCHNLAQLIVAYFVAGVFLVYFPFLMIAGIITGFFTGLTAHLIRPYLIRSKALTPFSPKSDGGN